MSRKNKKKFDPSCGWILNVTDRNGERIDGNVKQIHFGILVPPDPYFARLAPGEIQPISGKLPKFRVENVDEGSTSELKHAEFRIVPEEPEEPGALPPYIYVLPAGDYSARFSATFRKRDSSDVRTR